MAKENLSVVISVEDEASAALQSIANTGQATAESMASAGDAASASFESAQNVIKGTQAAFEDASNAIQGSFGGVQNTLEDTKGAIEDAAGAADAFAGSTGQFEETEAAIEDASGAAQDFSASATDAAGAVDAFGETQGRIDEATGALEGAAEAADQFSDAAMGAAGSAESFAGSQGTIEDTASALEDAATAAEGYSAAAEQAAGASDAFGGAQGNIEQTAGALESAAAAADEYASSAQSATATSEELDEMFALCEQAAAQCTMSIDAEKSIFQELRSAIVDAEIAYGQLSASQQEAASSSGEYEAALSAAHAALDAQASGYEAALVAMENYDAVIISGTEDLRQLEATAESTMHAGEDLAEANGNASQAMDALREAAAQAGVELQNVSSGAETAATSTDGWTAAVGNYEASALEAIYTTEELVEMGYKTADSLNAAGDGAAQAGESLAEASSNAASAADALADSVANVPPELDSTAESAKATGESLGELGAQAEKSTETSIEGFSELENLLASAGIAVGIKEITETLYEMADAASQAQRTVMLATGATGDSLDSLTADMMNAFGSARYSDLQNTAVGIGEVNTRMGLTGTELSKVTNKFTDFANVTGGNVQSSVASVTQIMNKWGLESSSLDSILDQLVYTGQATGVSVEGLTKNLISGQAQFSQMGISVEGAVSLLGALELQGVNSSSVLMGLRNAVKGFAADGVEASAGLEQTITAIQNAGTAAEATAIACDVFGARAGVELASAVRSGAVSLDTLKGNLDQAHGSLQKTADASLTMGQKWEQAQSRMSAAWASATAPMIESFMEGLTNIINCIADFASENQALVAALTGAAVGFGAFLAVLAAYKIAMSIATAVTTAFGAATTVALGPIALIVAAIGAVIGIVTAFAGAVDEETQAYEEATPASREHADAVRELQAEYDALVESEGEAAAAQSELAGELAAARAEYELTYQTMEQLQQSNADAIQASQDFRTSVHDQVISLEQAPTAAQAYIGRLMELGSQSTHTAGEMQLMEGLVSELNGLYPELGASVDDFMNASSGLAESLQQQMDAMQQAAEQQAYLDMYQEATENAARLAVQQDITNRELDTATRRWEELCNEFGAGASVTQDAAEQMYALQEETENLASESDAANETIRQLEDGITALGEEAAAASEEFAAAFEAMGAATQGDIVGSAVFVALQDDINSVCQMYDEAAAAASDSLMKQADAWHALEADTSTSLQDVMSNMDTSISTMQSYGDNLTSIHDYLVNQLHYTEEAATQALDTLNTGTPEAIGLTQQLAADIQNGGSAVGEYVQKTRELEQAADTAGQKMAQTRSDVQQAFQQIQTDAQNIITELDLGPEATTAANNTFQAYLNAMNPKLDTMASQAQTKGQQAANNLSNAIRGGTDEAAGAIQDIITKISQIPTSKTFTFNVVQNGSMPNPTKQYATGTRFSTDDVYIAGEEGPELIVGGYGSTVYTADETRDIFDALSSRQAVDVAATGSLRAIETPVVDAPADMAEPERTSVPERSERTVNINLNGHGIIRSDGSVSKEQVVGILQDNLRSVLIDIVQEETFEEGAGAFAH